jgi:hypothetical protein
MSSEEKLEQMFTRLAERVPARSSLVDSVMDRIEQSSASPAGHPGRSWIIRSTVGVAACLLIGVGVWLASLVLVPSVTLAQVESAIANQKWMHVKYDNGREAWTLLGEGKSYYRDTDGRAVFLDMPNNRKLHYWPDSGCIHESTLYMRGSTPPPWKPETPLEIIGISMDLPEGEAPDDQKQQRWYSERHNETVDGRRLVRFDKYARDALGEHLLKRQVWVDPQTHLPVRIRARLQLGEREEADRRYTTGECDFPAHGPESIHDLGVPRDLPIVRPEEEPPADVAQVIEKAREARDRFPTRYRVIVWQERQSEIDVIYRDGAPEHNGEYYDWEGVKVRQARYFNLDGERHPDRHLPMPASAEEVLAWTETQVPVALSICDGQRCLSQTSYDLTSDPAPPRVHAYRLAGRILFDNNHWPTRYQWPFVDYAGPFVLVTDEAEAAPNTIVLRRETGKTRREFQLDPARDHITMHWIWWEKRGRNWEKDREYKLLDLEQLPQGHWYARKKYLRSYEDPERGYAGYEVTWNIDCQILTEDQFPPDAFNGDKLLEDAKSQGATIETQ